MSTVAAEKQEVGEKDQKLIPIVEYLFGSKSSIHFREGVVGGKRIKYFKGKRAFEALISNPDLLQVFLKSETTKGSTTKQVEEEKTLIATAATECLNLLISKHVMVKIEREDGAQKKVFSVSHKQNYEENSYFVTTFISDWDRKKGLLYSAILILIIFAGVMFPLWPESVRTGVWYLSLGSLWLFGGLMVLAIIRLIIYAFSLVLGKGFWLFPNLFADVGIIDSFIPLYGYDGINYERMHLEKYRRAMKKKKPKKGEETGDQKESKKDQ